MKKLHDTDNFILNEHQQQGEHILYKIRRLTFLQSEEISLILAPSSSYRVANLDHSLIFAAKHAIILELISCCS
jgi:hypothetical protein